MRTLDSIFEFAGGKISSADELPLWLVDAHVAFRENDDWEQSLSDQGAEIVESYGMMNETVDVWRYEGGGWLVDWQDTDSVVMSFYIANVVDFALFQTAWLCSMATKIMAADIYIRANSERQLEEEKAAASIH